MTRIRFEGTIGSTNQEAIVLIVDAWVGAPQVRIRTIGEEIVYRDDEVFIRCHMLSVRDESPPWHNVEGEWKGEVETVRARLEELLEICRARQLDCDLEYSVFDDNDRQLGGVVELP